MTRWQKNRMWCMGLFLTCLFLLLAGCDGGGSDNCGGIDDIISCVTITNISPSNETINIDDCSAEGFPDPVTVSFTFRNDAFPSFVDGVPTENLSVTIQSVSVTYTPQCGSGQECPFLDGFSEPLTVFIPENSGTATASITLTSSFTQGQYADEVNGDPNNLASYVANYKFRVQTNFFQDNFDLDAAVPFTISCS